MKKLTAIFVVLFAVTFSSNVFAQASSDVATADASARIITPIDITKVDNLVFGNIAASSSTGTVVIAPDATGTRTSAGGVTPSVIGSYGSAEFTVTGEANSTYTISVPSSVTISDGNSHSMTVNNFLTNEADLIGTFSPSGSQTIYVGATLNVGASQATGNYTGSYAVTVAYN